MAYLPPDVKEKLEEILTKDPQELRQDEIDFLNARRWVLNPYQRIKFAHILVDATEEEKAGKVPPMQTQYVDPAQLNPNAVEASTKKPNEEEDSAETREDEEIDYEAETGLKDNANSTEHTETDTESENTATEDKQEEDTYDVDPNAVDPSAL